MSTLVIKSARVIRTTLSFLICAILAVLLVWRAFTFDGPGLTGQIMCITLGIMLIFTGIAAANTD